MRNRRDLSNEYDSGLHTEDEDKDTDVDIEDLESHDVEEDNLNKSRNFINEEQKEEIKRQLLLNKNNSQSQLKIQGNVEDLQKSTMGINKIERPRHTKRNTTKIKPAKEKLNFEIFEEAEESPMLAVCVVQGHGLGEVWGLATHPSRNISVTASDDGTIRSVFYRNNTN